MRPVLALIFAASVPAAAPCWSQFTSYAGRSQFAMLPPGVAASGLQGFVNPAVLAGLEAPETVITWAAGDRSPGGHNDWGLFSSLPHVGFGVLRRQVGGAEFNDYRLGFGGGDRDAAVGLGWGWSSAGGPDPLWVAGALMQPSTRWSAGLTWTSTFDGDAYDVAADVGLRPWATPRLTLFAEGASGGGDASGETWSAGADVRLTEGLHLSARYFDDDLVSIGLRAELGGLGLWTQTRRDGDRNRIHNLHAVRLGPHRGSALTPLTRRQPRMVRFDLHGPVRHRRFPLFDDGRSHLDLLAQLRRVQDDPSLAGVAVNLSGLRLDAALSWELRQRLQRLRDAGKLVVVYLDRGELRHYHLASVADRIVLDPTGGLALRGFAAGQLYLRGALDKLGIGSQAWHYHEYKTGPEPFFRTDMSDADREQWQVLVDGAYERARRDICAARGLSAEAFDALVDDVALFSADEALTHGLVDTLGRWEAVEAQVAAAAGPGRWIEAERLRSPVDEQWGRPPTIALVYALGLCAMDTGIRARSLSEELVELGEEGSVDAIVLRVDSPGGDALASDLVAEALREARAHKPVIVSQARLATSGGYWVSMGADAIVASPETITGNIGVWAGWLYNQGFRERLGLSIDHVQAGAHADLGLGMPLPLLGMSLPDRPLDEAEADRFGSVLESLYGDFVHRVAEARDRSPEDIDAVARGRVWSGPDALEAGLVDTLGGLETALVLARERADLDAERPLRVIEKPALSWFAMPALPGPLSHLGARSRPEPLWLEWLQLRLALNGQPLLLAPEPILDELDLSRAWP